VTRHTTDSETGLRAREAEEPTTSAALRVHGSSSSGLTQRRHAPRTGAEVEERYVAARDAWAAAMRAANSGRPADLAALALAQEAYEAAVAERKRWETGGRTAIPIEPEDDGRKLGAVVGQELAWRQVRTVDDKPAGILGRIRRRLRGEQG
jgi:hypothetical protein